MIEYYGNPWDRIVADCVALKYPDLKKTPTDRAIASTSYDIILEAV